MVATEVAQAAAAKVASLASTAATATVSAAVQAEATAQVTVTASDFSFSIYPFEFINIFLAVVVVTFILQYVVGCCTNVEEVEAKVTRGRVANIMAMVLCSVIIILMCFLSSIADGASSWSTEETTILSVASWMTCIWLVWDLVYRFSGFLTNTFCHNVFLIILVQLMAVTASTESAAIYTRLLFFSILTASSDILMYLVMLLGSLKKGREFCIGMMWTHIAKCFGLFIWCLVLYVDFSTDADVSGDWQAMWVYGWPIFNFIVFCSQLYPVISWLSFGLDVDGDIEEEIVDEGADARYRHPMETCSAASQLTLCWMEPMLWLGTRRPLQLDDVYDLPYSSRSAAVNQKFETAWEAEKASAAERQRQDPDGDHEPSLCRVLLKTFGRFRYIVPFQIGAISALVFTPLLVYMILLHIEDSNADLSAYMEGLALWCSLCLSAFSTGQAFHYCNHMAVNIQSACMNAVYRKLFTLSTSSIQESGSSMVNMLSGDSQRVYMMFYCLAHLTNVVGTFVSTALLFIYVGYAAFAALVVMVLVVPFQFWLGHNMHFIRADMVSCTDKRVAQTSEFLSGVRLIKMQGWEDSFKKKILDRREDELFHLWRLFRFRITNSMVTFVLPTLVTTLVFLTYVLIFDQSLDIATTFATLAVLSVMRPGFFLLPIVLISAAEGTVAIRRFQKFLMLDEMKVSRNPSDVADGEYGVHDDDDAMDGETVEIKINLPGGGLQGGGRGVSIEKIEDVEIIDDEYTVFQERLPKGVAPIVIRNGDFQYYPSSDLQSIVEEASKGGGAPGPPQGNVDDDFDDFDDSSPLIQEEKELVPQVFSNHQLHLTNINLRVEPGQLVCVVGSVGSGKSSLVQAILGEMMETDTMASQGGYRSLTGRVAYAGQDVWILNDTIRNNIIFHQPYDQDLYDQVLEAAQLEADLRTMHAGDLTVVGERGVCMSGGQKARLSLARILYRAHYSDIFVLDDLLAALDMQTLKAVLELGLLGLLHGKTRVIVMNSNYFDVFRQADQLIILSEGNVAAIGSYDELVDEWSHVIATDSDGSLRRDAQVSEVKSNDVQDDVVGDLPTFDKEEKKSKIVPDMPTTPSAESSPSFLGEDVTKTKQMEKLTSEHARTSLGRLGHEEHRVVGILDFKLYHDYFNAAWDYNGTFVFCTLLFFITIAQCSSCASDIWLADWAAASEAAIDDDTTLTYAENMYYIEYFLLILGIVTVFAFIKAFFYMSTAYRSGKRLHERALDKLVNAPVHEYFDVVPTGRILNRFSKDLDAVDLLLVDFLFEFLETAIFIIALLIVCAISVPEMLIVFFPLTFVFYKTRQMFSKASREMKRIESTSRSPVFSTFGETVSGLAHIRAYGEEDIFRKQYCDRLDIHLKTTFHLNNITPWNIIRLDLVGSFVVLTIAICIVSFEGTISETLSALALAYSVQLESRLTEAVWKSIETENYMTQMERLEHFQHIPQESEEGDDVDTMWPKEGKVEFENVDFRYRADLPDVLHKVSFEVLPEERVGICGRTGSGKSSLMVVLFRLGELGCDELGRRRGVIRIDGVDISQIKLKDLRSRISIIPQMPWLFAGTMRENLDPNGTKSDADIWTALRHAQLEQFVRSQPDGLDSRVVERGANLSQGQRQLLCIARALVRKSQVVMMDEATANIDSATDKEIQATIRNSFSQYTTLTIAHRLSTIADSDRILVLNNGHVVEHDAPHRLLNATFERPIGFAALVRELAPESMEDIKKIASAAATHRGQLALL